ncbi:MAG: hypothetical protein P8M16_08490 [Acidimicrobiales bacterium]|nr:hypothetical protein [Acidimicrobiales bacterium]
MKVTDHEVLVAPREVHDLVFRCARVAGLDVGAADRVGRNVTFAEVHLGEAVNCFVSVLNDSVRLLTEYDLGPDVLVSAEVEAKNAGSASVVFGVPTPLAALASVIADIEGRGIGVDGVPEGATGATVVERLQIGGPALPAGLANTTRAARDGLVMNSETFDALNVAAREFLVAESVLDEIEG